ncbi:hypothetical protein C8J56DRAFT_930435 [Mycena floridula]|nr:hypothetical protein C8J56DRAFT_930435 [Mycena floridula]
MSPSHDRTRPHVSIPSGARAPVNPSLNSPYGIEVTPPVYEDTLVNPWNSLGGDHSPTTPRARAMSTNGVNTPRQQQYMPFPEPHIFRSTSARAALQPSPGPSVPHNYSKSDMGHGGYETHRMNRAPSNMSMASSYYHNLDDVDQYTAEPTDVDEGPSPPEQEISLWSDEAIGQFQAGKLAEKDQEWHLLVPPEAREALGNQEVQRQSVIFEVFKAERDYVFDLKAVTDVYIEPLRRSNPPIIDPSRLHGFIAEVFGNLDQILANHQSMLAALFARQREQHPLVQSVADLILDTTLKSDFRSGYETYIKHYPLAESRHRTELKRNPAYQSFVQSVASDPRIRKRDLVTFLSRPVTRLPRLNLLLEQILKLTDKEHEHPDLETLPIILGILKDCIKSTQPGIEAAESKVKFWALCESLVYQKGEIIDLDLYDESRTLVYMGPVIRYAKTETGWTGWSDLSAALLDNHFILTREEKRPNGVVQRFLMSRPLPLSYLRLGAFNSPPESRKERAEGVLGGLLPHSVPIYPFSLYHAANSINRRYTLFVTSEAVRKKWNAAFVNALAIHKARQEGNMYFDPQVLSQHFFRVPGAKVGSAGQLTGRITSAVPFISGDRKFLAVGCGAGVFVAPRGQERFRKVLNYSSPTSMAALETHGTKVFNKFLISFEGSLLSYSLDLLARVSMDQADAKSLTSSMEKVAGQNSNILFFRHARIGQRLLVIYASKKPLHVTPTLHVLEAIDVSEAELVPKREAKKMAVHGFRPFGDPGYVPKDAYDLTALVKTVGVCTHDGIVILDPTNLAKSSVTVVPDFHDANSSLPMGNLKQRTDAATPLGLVRCDEKELLVVYDVLGCFITKHGSPSRSCGFIKWENKAVSYTSRGGNLLLFSPQFIEIRDVMTGRLVQTIEGNDLRLLYSPSNAATSDNRILVAMRGDRDQKDGNSDKIVELIETSEIPATAAPVSAAALWDEWDM